MSFRVFSWKKKSEINVTRRFETHRAWFSGLAFHIILNFRGIMTADCSMKTSQKCWG